MSLVLNEDVDDDLRHGVRGRVAGVEITPPPTFLCQHHLNHSNHLPNHSDRLNSDTLRMMIARTAGFMLDYSCNFKLCVCSQDGQIIFHLNIGLYK